MNTVTRTRRSNNNDILSVIPDVKGKPFNEAIEVADLNWNIESEQLNGMETGRVAIDRKGLFTSDNRFLGDVGKDYTPSEPQEFVQTVYDLANFSGYPVSKLGFLESKSQAIGFIDLKPLDINNDRLNVGIMVKDGFDGYTSRSYSVTMIRQVCSNGMVATKLIEQNKAKHTKGFVNNHEIVFKNLMQNLNGYIERLSEQFEKYMKKPLAKPQFENFVETLFPKDKNGERTKRTQKVVEEIERLFVRGVGNQGKTAWDAIGAIAEYETHYKTYRETERNTSDVNRFIAFSDKQNQSLTAKAMSILV